MDYLWLFATGIGPIILAIVFIYVYVRRTRRTPEERAASKEAVERHYSGKNGEEG